MDWFLYDIGLRHERVKLIFFSTKLQRERERERETETETEREVKWVAENRKDLGSNSH